MLCLAAREMVLEISLHQILSNSLNEDRYSKTERTGYRCLTRFAAQGRIHTEDRSQDAFVCQVILHQPAHHPSSARPVAVDKLLRTDRVMLTGPLPGVVGPTVRVRAQLVGKLTAIAAALLVAMEIYAL